MMPIAEFKARMDSLIRDAYTELSGTIRKERARYSAFLVRLAEKVGPGGEADSPYITMISYGPELLHGQCTGGSDPTECTDLEGWLAQAVALAEENGVPLVYGPSANLIASEFEPGVSYQVNCDRVANLAAMLRPGDIWFVRPFQFQGVCHHDMQCFHDLTAETVDAVAHGGQDARLVAGRRGRPGLRARRLEPEPERQRIALAAQQAVLVVEPVGRRRLPGQL